MTSTEFTLNLSASLRLLNLTHAIYDVMCAVAVLEATQGFATIPQVHLRLACTYNNVQLHLFRNPGLFMEEAGHAPRRFRLSAEGGELLAKANLAVQRRAATAANLESSTAAAS